jgi:ATP-dependent Clp protease ATP-binding subunit ClpB
VAAALLSDRYIADRFLPDKAIDLVDEAAAKVKMAITSKPADLEALDRKLMQLEMEKLSLQTEHNGGGAYSRRDRLDRIDQDIADLTAQQQHLGGQWQREKQTLEAINSLKEEEDQLRLQIEQAERAYDLNRAAQLKYGRMETVQRDREAKEAELLEIQAEGTTLLREQVIEADIAEIVAKWTGHSGKSTDGFGTAKTSATRGPPPRPGDRSGGCCCRRCRRHSSGPSWHE